MVKAYPERQHSTKMPRHSIKKRPYTALHHHTSALPHFAFSHCSIACERHPNRNEDSIFFDPQSGLAAVFDGVGGSAAGEIASQTAARATRERWQRILQENQKGRKRHTFLEQSEQLNLCTSLQDLVLESDELVRTQGAKRAGTDDLATTIALAAFYRQPEKREYQMVYAHVGDSRIYIMRASKPLKRLTSDDGLLAKLVENQIVTDDDAFRIDQAVRADQLSDTEYSYF